MIKEQIYSFCQDFIEEFFYGFKKEDLDIGIVKGFIRFKNLKMNIEKCNHEMTEKGSFPFYLKFLSISEVIIKFSIMNIISEQPIEIKIKGINIIFTLSHKFFNESKVTFCFLTHKIIPSSLELPLLDTLNCY